MLYEIAETGELEGFNEGCCAQRLWMGVARRRDRSMLVSIRIAVQQGMSMQAIRSCLYAGTVSVLLMSTVAQAQMPAYDEPGPVPPAIATANTVFVANGGSDVGLFPYPFTGDEDRGYTEFYAALKATGAYTLVGDPSQADLVLELRLAMPHGVEHTIPLPQFTLAIYDRKTHYTLWTITEAIQTALSQKNRDKEFDASLNMVLSKFLRLAGKTPGAAAGPAAATPATH